MKTAAFLFGVAVVVGSAMLGLAFGLGSGLAFGIPSALIVAAAMRA